MKYSNSIPLAVQPLNPPVHSPKTFTLVRLPLDVLCLNSLPYFDSSVSPSCWTSLLWFWFYLCLQRMVWYRKRFYIYCKFVSYFFEFLYQGFFFILNKQYLSTLLDKHSLLMCAIYSSLWYSVSHRQMSEIILTSLYQ